MTITQTEINDVIDFSIANLRVHNEVITPTSVYKNLQLFYNQTVATDDPHWLKVMRTRAMAMDEILEFNPGIL